MKNSSQEVSKIVKKKKKKKKKDVMEIQPKPTVFYGEKKKNCSSKRWFWGVRGSGKEDLLI